MSRQARAVEAVLDTIGEWLDTLAPSFTCTEAETLAELLNAYDRPDDAAAFITAHAEGDEPGDRHYDQRTTGDDGPMPSHLGPTGMEGVQP